VRVDPQRKPAGRWFTKEALIKVLGPKMHHSDEEAAQVLTTMLKITPPVTKQEVWANRAKLQIGRNGAPPLYFSRVSMEVGGAGKINPKTKKYFSSVHIAAELGCSEPTVRIWQDFYGYPRNPNLKKGTAPKQKAKPTGHVPFPKQLPNAILAPALLNGKRWFTRKAIGDCNAGIEADAIVAKTLSAYLLRNFSWDTPPEDVTTEEIWANRALHNIPSPGKGIKQKHISYGDLVAGGAGKVAPKSGRYYNVIRIAETINETRYATRKWMNYYGLPTSGEPTTQENLERLFPPKPEKEELTREMLLNAGAGSWLQTTVAGHLGITADDVQAGMVKFNIPGATKHSPAAPAAKNSEEGLEAFLEHYTQEYTGTVIDMLLKNLPKLSATVLGLADQQFPEKGMTVYVHQDAVTLEWKIGWNLPEGLKIHKKELADALAKLVTRLRSD